MDTTQTNFARSQADGYDNIAPTTQQGQQAWQYAQSDNFFSPEEQAAVMRRELEPYRNQIEGKLAAIGHPPQHFAQFPQNEEALYSGRATGLIRINLAPDIQVEGRLHIVMTEEGPDFRFTPAQHQRTIPNEVGGVVLTKGERQQLAEEGALPGPILTIDKNRYVPTYLRVDELTNSLELCMIKPEQLPNKLMGIDLTREQQLQLVNGHSVRLSGLLDRQNEPFNATVSISPARQTLQFSDFNRLDVVLKPDNEYRHQVTQNNEVAKTDLTRSRETALGSPTPTHHQGEVQKQSLAVDESADQERAMRVRR